MNARLGYSARAWVLSTATPVMWCAAALIVAQTTSNARGADPSAADRSNTQESAANPKLRLKSAIQQELEALYAKKGEPAPNMMPAANSGQVAAGTPAKTAAPSTLTQTASGSRSASGQNASAVRSGAARISGAPQDHLRSYQQEIPKTAVNQSRLAGSPPVSGQPGDVSEIQRQLADLYRRDGKAMPNFDYAAAAQQAQGTLAQNQQQIIRNGQLPPNQQQNQATSNRRKRTGLLQRLNPFRNRRRSGNHPSVVRRAMRRNGNQLPDQKNVARQAETTTVPETTEQADTSRPGLLPSFLRLRSDRKSVARPIDPNEIDPNEIVALPEEETNDDELDFFPDDALAAEDDSEQFAVDAQQPPATETPQATVTELKTAQSLDQPFSNPFTEISEAEADETALEKNPFVSLDLNEQQAADDDEADTASEEADDDRETEMLADTDSESHEPASLNDSEDTPVADAGEETVAAETQDDDTPVAETTGPRPDGEDEVDYHVVQHASAMSALEKLQRIAQRVDRKGLKGFCPVTLRDERNLADSKPEYRSIYRSKQYDFASAEAKAKFDANPGLYAPVEGGLDVMIQTSHDDDVEGTLDHAVWFRDRLYLFSSQETMQAFIQQPTEYAVGE